MSYRPSGDVEAVLAEIRAGSLDSRSDLTSEAATARTAMAIRRQRLATSEVAERPALLGDDPAAMEHEAAWQAWLARVQRVNWR